MVVTDNRNSEICAKQRRTGCRLATTVKRENTCLSSYVTHLRTLVILICMNVLGLGETCDILASSVGQQSKKMPMSSSE